jgi:hypothetical protein
MSSLSDGCLRALGVGGNPHQTPGVYRGGRSSVGYRQFEKIEPWPFQMEFQALHLAATNVLHFILGDWPGAVWIADVSVTRKKGQ